MRASSGICLVLVAGAAFALVPRQPSADPRLKKAFRRAPQNGWTFVHLEGNPSEIGFQHGALLSREIVDGQRTIASELTHDTKKSWQFFRDAAKDTLWPHIEDEYRRELEGIAEGVRSRGVKLDVWDIVATNAWLEFNPYYVQWYDKKHGITSPATVVTQEHCSALIATGSYTKDGKIVMAHNAWTGYGDGQRWNIVLSIKPAKGNHIMMDGYPGLIHSADDFAINSAGMMITETTISGFSGFDPDGIPEFVRARKAAQYARSIDDFARIMRDGNNGGYANTWLAGDRKTGEIASLELGLKNVTLKRTTDGYFAGSNFPANENLIREETDFKTSDMALSANARHARWDQLMVENKGKIDIAAGERFLADHYDTFDKKPQPGERSLCGHIDLSPRGSEPWQPPFGVAGAVQNKVTDSTMAEQLSFRGAAGHACGLNFKAAEHLAKHPQFAWQREFLRDLNSQPWTTFRAR